MLPADESTNDKKELQNLKERKKNMKTTRTIILTLMLVFTTFGTQAQNAKQRMSREQMAETQAKHIAADLNLTGKTYDRFVETYENYKKELWQTVPKCRKKNCRNSETEEQAAEKMRKRFERSQKVLDIRNKYYQEFSKFLTQKQIEQMYEKERKMMKRLSERRRANHGKRR